MCAQKKALAIFTFQLQPGHQLSMIRCVLINYILKHKMPNTPKETVSIFALEMNNGSLFPRDTNNQDNNNYSLYQNSLFNICTLTFQSSNAQEGRKYFIVLIYFQTAPS